jgi:hypothetical protein
MTIRIKEMQKNKDKGNAVISQKTSYVNGTVLIAVVALGCHLFPMQKPRRYTSRSTRANNVEFLL